MSTPLNVSKKNNCLHTLNWSKFTVPSRGFPATAGLLYFILCIQHQHHIKTHRWQCTDKHTSVYR